MTHTVTPVQFYFRSVPGHWYGILLVGPVAPMMDGLGGPYDTTKHVGDPTPRVEANNAREG
jgi:hypothetical protein